MATAAVSSALSTKVTADEKSRFIETCNSIGTSPSNALRMFVSAFNSRGGFPFDSANPNGYSYETVAAIRDAMNGKVIGPFKTNEEMWSSIFDDED